MASQTGNQDIARRYALAFFQLAQEQSQTDAVAQDLSMLGKLFSSTGDFQKFIHNPLLRRAAQADAIVEIAQQLKLSALTVKLLGTLAQKRRLPQLPGIAAATAAFIAEEKGEITAHVTAAQALDQTQIAAIAATLKKALGKDVRVDLRIDADILGGLVLQVGSRRVDSSVRTKLDRLHRALKNTNSSSDQKKMKEVA